MAFAPKACFYGYHELFAFILGSFQEKLNDQPDLIRWLIIKIKALK